MLQKKIHQRLNLFLDENGSLYPHPILDSNGIFGRIYINTENMVPFVA